MKRPFHRHSTESGYTLLEMLLVLVIIGILGAIVAPGWFQYIANRRAQTVQTELKQVLQQAQNTARTTRQMQYVEIDEEATLPTVKIGDDPANLTAVTLVEGELKPGMVTLDINIPSAATSEQVAYDYSGAVSGGDLFIIRVTAKGTERTYCLASLTLIGGVQSGLNDECETFETVVTNN